MPVALSNLLHVARDAMSVNARALDVTGQNIANVNTAGYARRRVEIQARAATKDSYGGVTIGSITRAADQLTQRRLLDVRGQEQSARERGDALAPVEAAFNDANGTGLAGGLTRLFDAFNALASRPTDTTARAGVLSAAQSVVESFSLATEALDASRADLFAKAQGFTKQINESARAIADLNGSIQSALASGQDAADLLDRRDQILAGLSELVDVQVATNPNGSLFVRAAGQSLVEGSSASSLSVDLDALGNLAFKASVAGSTPTAFSAGAMGGKLGGLRQARDEDMTALRQRLDTLAGDLAGAVNALHGGGFGLDGQTGRNLFSFNPAVGARSLEVDPAVAGQPDRVAASSSTATGGNDVARQLAALDTTKASAGGTKSLLDSYADLVGDLGLRRQKATDDADVKGALADQVEAIQQSATGVSLDEEMVDLTRFQRAYEASSKLLKTFDELMQTLINSA
jgi:flagellar hook-associated protein 1 FlgK